jgi:TIR domain
MPLQGFISYAHADRKIAGQIKAEFGAFQISCFLAHEDLDPSVEWQREITRSLKVCDLFLPVICKNFRESKWTDQEVGMAVAWKKPIIPLSLGPPAPYGFMGKYQAIKIAPETVGEKCLTILRKLASHPKLGAAVRDGIIDGFLDSKSFDESRRRSRWLTGIDGFSPDQLNRLLDGSATNVDIYRGFDARAVVAKLTDQHEKQLTPKLVKRFREVVSENW